MLVWVFVAGLVTFVGMLLFRSLFASPKCPQCRSKMEESESVDVVQKGLFQIEAAIRWRVVTCPRCERCYRVPGISME